MSRSPRTKLAVGLTSAGLLAALAIPLTSPAQAAPTPVVDRALLRSAELSETRRLADRRTVVTGDRAWALGTADGYYPAAGFHTRGEMGGFWLPNLKLLDGMWFGINGGWIGAGTRTTTGWGYVRTDLPDTGGSLGQPYRFRARRGLRRAGRAQPALGHGPRRSPCGRTPTRS